MATVPAPWDSGPGLKMCWCHHLGELWFSMVVQLSAGGISTRQSASANPQMPSFEWVLLVIWVFSQIKHDPRNR